MMRRMMLAVVLGTLAAAARAETPAELQASFLLEARREDPAFAGFSAERGRAFFDARHGAQWSCSTCHGSDPRAVGRHAVTGQPIEPLAPAANPARFTRAAKVEKWFRRNCNDVLGRACTAREKGDVLAWLSSLDARGMR
jgi:hypothetical protein